MYIEPYGLLDLDVLETYIKSMRSESVTRAIKITYMAIAKFLDGVVIREVKDNSSIESLMELTGIKSVGKATILFNKINKGKPVTEAELGTSDLSSVQECIRNNSKQILVTESGEVLSDFQAKFVTNLKMKFSRYRKGSKIGINYILDLIECFDIQTCAAPYILQRSIEKVMNYQQGYYIINALNICDKYDVLGAVKSINRFQEEFLKSSTQHNSERLKVLIAKEASLSHLLNSSYGGDLNYLSYEYLKFKIQNIDYRYFNELSGTDLSEREIHTELTDLTTKGLVGFNLCMDTLLTELSAHGSNYENSEIDVEDIGSNDNISFIIGNLKPLLELEVRYRR